MMLYFFQGLRWPMILGTFLTAAGACIKIASVGQDLFWVTFIGQSFVAVGQVFMMSVPPVIAAIWFGDEEVSTACSIGVFGYQVCTGMLFLLNIIQLLERNDVCVFQCQPTALLCTLSSAQGG